MKRPEKLPIDTNTLGDMTYLYYKESDRAMVLIASAWVDDALAEYLQAGMVNDDKRVSKFFCNMSFAEKIDLAYITGKIDSFMLRQLTELREIRNVFAHSRLKVDLSRADLKERAEKLGPGTPPKFAIFLLSMIYLVFFIYRRDQAKRVVCDARKDFRGTVEDVRNAIIRLTKSKQ